MVHWISNKSRLATWTIRVYTFPKLFLVISGKNEKSVRLLAVSSFGLFSFDRFWFDWIKQNPLSTWIRGLLRDPGRLFFFVFFFDVFFVLVFIIIVTSTLTSRVVAVFAFFVFSSTLLNQGRKALVWVFDVCFDCFYEL